MGVFDTVVFPCPDCGKKLSEQTKSGECNCNTYHINSAPLDVLASLILGAKYDEIRCDRCEAIISFDYVVHIKPSVKYSNENDDEDDDEEEL